MQLISVKYKKPNNTNVYPFNIPLFEEFNEVKFTSDVTFFVGENGTGKSTLLNGIDDAVGSINIGEDSIGRDSSMKKARELSKYLKLTWNKKAKKGFFLRAEDFISYTKRIVNLREEMERELKDIDSRYDNRSDYSKNLASMPYKS